MSRLQIRSHMVRPEAAYCGGKTAKVDVGQDGSRGLARLRLAAGALSGADGMRAMWNTLEQRCSGCRSDGATLWPRRTLQGRGVKNPRRPPGNPPTRPLWLGYTGGRGARG